MSEKAYLGDAVYYEHDGYMVTLTTSDGMRTTNTVHLEPQVLSALLRKLVADFGAEAIAKVIAS